MCTSYGTGRHARGASRGLLSRCIMIVCTVHNKYKKRSAVLSSIDIIIFLITGNAHNTEIIETMLFTDALAAMVAMSSSVLDLCLERTWWMWICVPCLGAECLLLLWLRERSRGPSPLGPFCVPFYGPLKLCTRSRPSFTLNTYQLHLQLLLMVFNFHDLLFDCCWCDIRHTSIHHSTIIHNAVQLHCSTSRW